MKRAFATAILIAAGAAAIAFWRSGIEVAAGGAAGEALADVTIPATLSDAALSGKAIFDASCAMCHGENAAGRDGAGPPLVHIIYEPNHHGDMSFLLAVQRGVRSHHWRFGDMPPVQGVSDEDVAAIVTYVRELQRANGIE